MTFTVAYGLRSTGNGPEVFNFQGGGLGTTFFSHSDVDPGPVIQLVPIPEPATVATASGVALAVVALIRRFRGTTPR